MKQSGFTLIEMMVVVVLIAILMTGVTNLLLSGLRGGGKAGVQTNLREQGETIITAMERGIRYGFNFDTTSSCFDGSDPNVIKLNRFVPLADGTTGERPVQYRYDSAAGQILYEVDLNDNPLDGYEESEPLNGTEVSVAVFNLTCTSYPTTPPKISVDFIIEDPTTLESIVYQTTIAVRNNDE